MLYRWHLRINQSIKYSCKFYYGVVHYLDSKTIDTESGICYKDTHTGQYMYFPAIHLGVSKQLGLEPCKIELQKYVVFRNDLMIKQRTFCHLCHGMDSLC